MLALLLRYGLFVIRIAQAFIVTPLIIRGLGGDEYATWTVIFSTLSYFSFSQNGVTAGVLHEVAVAFGERSKEKLSCACSTGLVAMGVQGLVVVTGGLGSLLFVPQLVGKGASSHSNVSLLLILVALAMGIGNLSGTFYATMMGTGKIAWAQVPRLVGTLGELLGYVTALQLGSGLLGMAFALVLVRVFELLVGCILDRTVCPSHCHSVGHLSIELAKNITGFGVWTSVIQLGRVLLQSSIPIIIIGIGLSSSAVAVFVPAYNVWMNIVVLSGIVADLYWPRIAEYLHSLVPLSQVYATVERILALSMILAAAGTGAFLPQSKAFLDWWLGERFFPGWPLLVIFSLIVLVKTWQHVFIDIFSGMGRLRPLAWAMVIEGVFFVCLAYMLGSLVGLVGIGLAVLLSTVLVSLWYFPYLLIQRTNWRGGDLLHLAPLAIAALALGMICSHVLSIVWQVNGILFVFARVIVSASLAFLLPIWVFTDIFHGGPFALLQGKLRARCGLVGEDKVK